MVSPPLLADIAHPQAFPIMPASNSSPPLNLPDHRPIPEFGDTPDSGVLGDRIVAVTGASGGLGTSLCKSLAQRGATVVMLGRKLKKLETLYDVLEQSGSATPAMAELDLASHDNDDARAVAEMLYAEFGRLDALVHCAVETGPSAPQNGIDMDTFDRVFKVNVSAPRTLTLACLPLLEKSDAASVVWPLDHRVGAYVGAYGLSKSAVRALAFALAEEFEHKRAADGHPLIAINGYDPGPMRTPLRRRLFAGEHATESPDPTDRLDPLLHLIARSDRSLNGSALAWRKGEAPA